MLSAQHHFHFIICSHVNFSKTMSDIRSSSLKKKQSLVTLCRNTVTYVISVRYSDTVITSTCVGIYILNYVSNTAQRCTVQFLWPFTFYRNIIESFFKPIATQKWKRTRIYLTIKKVTTSI